MQIACANLPLYSFLKLNIVRSKSIVFCCVKKVLRRRNMSGKVLNPRESGVFIMEKAQDVSILDDGVKKCAAEIFEDLRSGKLSPRNFSQGALHPKPQPDARKAIDWIFLVDTLNFSFWSGAAVDEPKWMVKFKGETYTGYFALCAGINRAMEEEGLKLTEPGVYGSLSVDDIKRIFRSETSTPIPMVEERVASLQEVSRVLLDKYGGSFVNVVEAAGGSAQTLLSLIVSDFPCFRDTAVFDSVTVSLHKRAQILIGDVWACFQGEGPGNFHDIDSLTMFADYRVPQVLLFYGAIQYSSSLLEHLEKEGVLANGERLEVEIRGASIQAVEVIKEAIREKLTQANMSPNMINSILIDHFLWDYRRQHAAALDKYPYHKTRCIYY